MIDYKDLLQQFDTKAPHFFTSQRSELAKAHTAWFQLLQGKSWQEIALDFSGVSQVTTWQGAIDHVQALGTVPFAYSVLGVDGSQVYADRHSGLPWSLITIAHICFSYTPQSGNATFASTPILIPEYQEPSILDARRSLLELQKGVGQMLVKQNDLPSRLLLFDGPLSPSLNSEGDATASQQPFAELSVQYKAALQTCYEHKFLIAGYISAPRARELVRLLEAVLKHRDRKNQTDDFSAISLEQLSDTDLVTLFLRPGFHSAWFANTTCPIDLEPPLRLYMTYLHVGSEIVRVELPYYLAADPEKSSLILSIIIDQVKKGYGYPVVLAEAHEHAVVREADRQLFFQLAARKASELGVFPCASHKSLKKRFPLV